MTAKALSAKSWEYEPREDLGELKIKGTFRTRTTDGNKGWGVEETTINKKSLPMKQILSLQHLSVISH